jgi:hypothetical protein
MLFKFGKFWKSISFIVGSWVSYALFGFEFTTITILSLMIVSKFKDEAKLLL